MSETARDSARRELTGVIAIDTNVLVYALNEDDPHHGSSRSLIGAVASGQVPACVFPQNLLELYSVITDPRRVAHPLSPKQAMDELARLRSMVVVSSPKESSLDMLAQLVSPTGPRGSDIYDAFIVAQMKDAGIDVVCTYNLRDFEVFPVSALTPEQVMMLLGTSWVGPDAVYDRPSRD